MSAYNNVAYEQARTLSMMRMITAPISIIGSVAIIVLIARSRAKFSTTQNRLLLGLSVSDIISSLAHCLTSLPMPRGTPDAWLALGNTATCDAQGFVFLFGILTTPAYNAALCIFFLLKVRYDVNDDTMRTRVEPFLHGIPILISVTGSTYALIKEYFNPVASFCYVMDKPRFCSQSATVSCERGENFFKDWIVLSGYVYISVIIPLTIFGSMATIYFTVLRQEQRMARYGRGSLNLTASDETPRTQQSHYVKMTMYRALAYSIAWLIPFVWVIFSFVPLLSGQATSFKIRCCMAIFTPLQGLFNFIVFIYPKVLHERQSNPRYSLCQAFASALTLNVTIPVVRTRDRRERNRDQGSMVVRSQNDVVNYQGEDEEQQDDFIDSPRLQEERGVPVVQEDD